MCVCVCGWEGEFGSNENSFRSIGKDVLIDLYKYSIIHHTGIQRFTGNQEGSDSIIMP